MQKTMLGVVCLWCALCPQLVAQVRESPQPALGSGAVAPGEMKSLRVVAADRENLGNVAPRTLVRRTVTFENVGEYSVDLEVLNRSCGCLTATFDRLRVPPSERVVLSMAVQVAPSVGQEAQSVVFRSKWVTASNQEESERGVCVVRYQPTVAYMIRPERPAAVGYTGDRMQIDFFIRVLQPGTEMPSIESLRTTLPGWEAAVVSETPLPPQVRHVRASGPAPSRAGTVDGEIQWDTNIGEHRTVTVPVRIRGLWPLKSDPPGALFRLAPSIAGREVAPIALRGGPWTNCTIECDAPADTISVVKINENELRVTLHAGAFNESFGSARIRIARGGEALLEIPVAWMPAEFVPTVLQSPKNSSP